ncbi:jg17943 [Pararge aegeria aegeria]|uniref:Jg17943 protein n=1 Tax=Pararge aegeria aegeria TaxID=348720 RepID=A0A8S4RGK1_9NEOP|nr:jg17943 [Pararge aegeria aegeria]
MAEEAGALQPTDVQCWTSKSTVQRLPATRMMIPVYRDGGRLALRLPVWGRYPSTLGPQSPSILRAICSAHCRATRPESVNLALANRQLIS